MSAAAVQYCPGLGPLLPRQWSGSSVGSSLLDTIIQQSFQYFIFITAAVRAAFIHAATRFGLMSFSDAESCERHVLRYSLFRSDKRSQRTFR